MGDNSARAGSAYPLSRHFAACDSASQQGFTLTPDSELVIKIPSEVQVTGITVTSTLRKPLLVSFIPQMVCDHVLRNIRIVRQAGRTIGEVLITTKHWIQTMYRAPLPCNRHLYPAEWPRRHGHIFDPSWQYEGLCSHTLTLCTAQCSPPSFPSPVATG